MLLWLGFALAAMATAPVQAQTAPETLLHHFASLPHGAYPQAGVARDPAVNLYGTTVNGGAAGWGVVFKLDTVGRQTVLYNFTGGADGGNPSGGVLGASAGNFYGTTLNGGAASWGVVFKLDKSGHETVLYSFTGGTDGWNPPGGLIRDSAGNLYGTTGTSGSVGLGVVFKVDKSGQETVLYSFTNEPDGIGPPGGVIRDSAGNLYGTTSTTSGSAPGDRRFRACRRSRWSAARARNPGTKPGARRQPYSASHSIFRSGTRAGCRLRCIRRAAWPDIRAAANSSAPSRLRRCTDSGRQPGSASGSPGRAQYCPGNS